jgi:hypothetical protein
MGTKTHKGVIRKSNGPELPPPAAMKAAAQSAAVTGSTIGTEKVRAEILASLMKHGVAAPVHVGGALPPLFQEDVKQGDAALVRYLGYEIVGEERSGTGNGFTSLRFDVIDPDTLKVKHRASMPLAAVMFSFFEVESKEIEVVIDGKKKTDTEDHPTLDPEKTPVLLITFGGTGIAKKNGRNPPKLWVIEALPKDLKIAA